MERLRPEPDGALWAEPRRVGLICRSWGDFKRLSAEGAMLTTDFEKAIDCVSLCAAQVSVKPQLLACQTSVAIPALPPHNLLRWPVKRQGSYLNGKVLPNRICYYH